MPKYTFECQNDDCNVRFDRNLKMGDHLSHECPGCHDPAPRIIDTPFGFGFAETPGAAVGNTGVHKDDYPTADHLIGKDSFKRWGEYSERDKVKQVARDIGGTHALTRTTAADGSYIDYTPLTPAGRVSRRQAARNAVAALREGPLPEKPSAKKR